MRKDITITADARETRGKNAARRLRVSGQIPAVLYGAGGESVAVAVSPKEINRILHSKTGHNTIFNLDVPGAENSPVMVIDWSHDPVKDTLLHIDLKRIDLTKRLAVKVPVHTTGDPVGVKLEGGLLEIVTREIEIECLPDDIPEHFVYDVTDLKIGQTVRAGEVKLAEGMVLLSHDDQVICHVVAIRESVEATPAEGEAAAPGTEAKAEPEVIKKGKKEEEGAAPAADAKKKK